MYTQHKVLAYSSQNYTINVLNDDLMVILKIDPQVGRANHLTLRSCRYIADIQYNFGLSYLIILNIIDLN